ncbi:LacI family DNA-binding transcriptional regulator, partial [Brachyspira pilosicoli]
MTIKKITMKEIAEIAGVTKTTISRYYNGGYVKKETKEKIAKIIKK